MKALTGIIYKSDKGDKYPYGYYVKENPDDFVRLLTEKDLETPPDPTDPVSTVPGFCTENYDVLYEMKEGKYTEKLDPGGTALVTMSTDSQHNVYTGATLNMGIQVPPGVVNCSIAHLTANTWQNVYHTIKGVQGQVSKGGGYNQSPDPILYSSDEINYCDRLYGSNIIHNLNLGTFRWGSVNVMYTIGNTQKAADRFWTWYTNPRHDTGGTPECNNQTIAYTSCP